MLRRVLAGRSDGGLCWMKKKSKDEGLQLETSLWIQQLGMCKPLRHQRKDKDLGEENSESPIPSDQTSLIDRRKTATLKGIVTRKHRPSASLSCVSAKGGDPLPVHFTRPVQEAIHNYTCESVSSLSSSGQTTPTDLNHSWSGIQSYTTGLSTERSSVYSWRDDEFDKANTQRVHQLFWDVDEMLFEGNVTSQNKNLQAECKDWTKRSLHLRILGKQLIFPKDEEWDFKFLFKFSRGSQSITENSSSLRQLCVSGSRLVPTVSPLQRTEESTSSASSLGSDSSVYSFLEEEIYDVEGTIEEYLAYDSREHDDEGMDQKKTQLHQKRTKWGIPPVSPNDCMKDTIAAEVFDDTWRTIVESVQELLIKTWEVTSVEIKKAGRIHNSTNHYHQLPLPRITSGSAGVPPSRGSEARSISFGAYVFTSQTSRNFNSDLNGVMTIQAKPLQHRHAGLVEKTHDQEDKSLSVLPRVLNSARNRHGRLSDNSIFSSSRILHTPSRKTTTQRRLPSLTLDPTQAKGPNVYSDEVLRELPARKKKQIDKLERKNSKQNSKAELSYAEQQATGTIQEETSPILEH
ncbi:unnamed protein product [Ranitomeya imitator]|uniref:DUF3719 domain-containing protein n=1 Tax=Ranitomeya imitator TaxID=111125 RepID=A0ABN9MQ60_9NEOB|nr:unnamed protein product [Ranitomeya imitator]